MLWGYINIGEIRRGDSRSLYFNVFVKVGVFRGVLCVKEKKRLVCFLSRFIIAEKTHVVRTPVGEPDVVLFLHQDLLDFEKTIL